MINEEPQSNSSKGIDRLRSTLFNFLEGLDSVTPGPSNIFLREQGKIDFETKVWHHFHKIESADYHLKQIVNLAAQASKHLKNMKMPEFDGPSEFRFTFQDQKILFELEAFFAAVQSSIDFLACVLSRYIRGKNTDKFNKLHSFLLNGTDPISTLVEEAWSSWINDMTNYRDYFIHKGVLPSPIAMGITVKNSKIINSELESLRQTMFQEHNPVVFPVPTKPDPSIRITRREILGLDEPQIPPGIVEEVIEISISSENTRSGPEVSVSIGRNIGSSFYEAKSRVRLGNESGRVKSVQYKLAPGYIEAENLSKSIQEKLHKFSMEIFFNLTRLNFTHIR